MPVVLPPRDGPVFNEAVHVDFTDDRPYAFGTLRGSMKAATLTLGDGSVIHGRVRLVATKEQGDRPARSFKFEAAGIYPVYFGEQLLSAGKP